MRQIESHLLKSSAHSGEGGFPMPTRGEGQGTWALVHIPPHNRSQHAVCCDETYASVLEGKPFASGAFFRGERGSQLRKPRLAQPEGGVPHMDVRRVQGERFIGQRLREIPATGSSAAHH